MGLVRYLFKACLSTIEPMSSIAPAEQACHLNSPANRNTRHEERLVLNLINLEKSIYP